MGFWKAEKAEGFCLLSVSISSSMLTQSSSSAKMLLISDSSLKVSFTSDRFIIFVVAKNYCVMFAHLSLLIVDCSSCLPAMKAGLSGWAAPIWTSSAAFSSPSLSLSLGLRRMSGSSSLNKKGVTLCPSGSARGGRCF